jgi:hypothetical protein
MSRIGVVCLADSLMEEAEQWRARLLREWWRRPAERNRRLTGAWLAWTCAARARAHVQYQTASTREGAWMLGQAQRVLQRLERDPGARLETAMALLLWVARIDLGQPHARASYATWIGADGRAPHAEVPCPYRPQPERPAPWYQTALRL